MADDAELLRAYTTSGTQEAFSQFVERHLKLVYFAALRRTNGNPALAQDISQCVFSEVARHASTLAGHSTLTGWLYTATRNAAAKAMRSEDTRRRHEHNAAMHELTTAEPAQQWERLRPVIDDALDALDARDREAILIRFFEGRPFAEVGATLRISQDAARMRVDRALDKLRLSLERRGIKSVAAALATVLATQGGLALPAGLIATISGAAIPVGMASAASAASLGLMSATKITIAAASIAAALATAFLVVERNRAQRAEATVAAASTERAALESQLARTKANLEAAEIRAVEAEKDTGKLLDALPTAPAKQPLFSKLPTPEERVAIRAMVMPFLEDIKKRHAKHRDEEIIKRATNAADTRHLDPEAAFNLKINAVEDLVASGAFQLAKGRLHEAILERLTGDPLPESVRKLQAFIEAQGTPAEITFVSDGQTFVAMSNLGQYLRIINPLITQTETIPPGNYEIIGRRKGYQDVIIPVQVRSGLPPPTVNVICTVPSGP